MIENEQQYQTALARKQEYIAALSSLHLEIKDKVLLKLCSELFKSYIEDTDAELKDWEDNLPNKVVDKSYFYEARDRCSIMSTMVQDFLLKSPAIKSNPSWQHKIEMSVSLIEQVYQSIGEGL